MMVNRSKCLCTFASVVQSPLQAQMISLRAVESIPIQAHFTGLVHMFTTCLQLVLTLIFITTDQHIALYTLAHNLFCKSIS